jgi:hypothetical protein
MCKVKFVQNRGKIRYSDIAPYLRTMRAVTQLPVLYPGICLTTEENNTEKNLSQGIGIVSVGDDNHNNATGDCIFRVVVNTYPVLSTVSSSQYFLNFWPPKFCFSAGNMC